MIAGTLLVKLGSRTSTNLELPHDHFITHARRRFECLFGLWACGGTGAIARYSRCAMPTLRAFALVCHGGAVQASSKTASGGAAATLSQLSANQEAWLSGREVRTFCAQDDQAPNANIGSSIEEHELAGGPAAIAGAVDGRDDVRMFIQQRSAHAFRNMIRRLPSAARRATPSIFLRSAFLGLIGRLMPLACGTVFVQLVEKPRVDVLAGASGCFLPSPNQRITPAWFPCESPACRICWRSDRPRGRVLDSAGGPGHRKESAVAMRRNRRAL